MSRKVNYHTHTTYCDGNNSPEEMVVAAIEKGFSELGFSGHSYTPFDTSYCMTPDSIAEYVKEIDRLKKVYAGKIIIKCGIEMDYFSETDTKAFDYVIGSVHYVLKNGVYYPVDFTKEEFIKAVNTGWDGDYCAFAEDYFELVGNLAEKVKADIIGHFDLITKFNENEALFSEDDPRYVAAAKNAADKLLSKNTLFEINTGAMQRGYRSKPYPSEWILNYILSNGGKVIVSSDCHDKSGLDFGFKQAEELINKCK